MGCRPFTELNFSPSLWQAVSEKEEKEGRIPNPKNKSRSVFHAQKIGIMNFTIV